MAYTIKVRLSRIQRLDVDRRAGIHVRISQGLLLWRWEKRHLGFLITDLLEPTEQEVWPWLEVFIGVRLIESDEALGRFVHERCWFLTEKRKDRLEDLGEGVVQLGLVYFFPVGGFWKNPSLCRFVKSGDGMKKFGNGGIVLFREEMEHR